MQINAMKLIDKLGIKNPVHFVFDLSEVPGIKHSEVIEYEATALGAAVAPEVEGAKHYVYINKRLLSEETDVTPAMVVAHELMHCSVNELLGWTQANCEEPKELVLELANEFLALSAGYDDELAALVEVTE